MKLEEIGFYTLEDYRAKNASCKSPLWRNEMIITARSAAKKEVGGDDAKSETINE